MLSVQRFALFVIYQLLLSSKNAKENKRNVLL